MHCGPVCLIRIKLPLSIQMSYFICVQAGCTAPPVAGHICSNRVTEGPPRCIQPWQHRLGRGDQGSASLGCLSVATQELHLLQSLKIRHGHFEPETRRFGLLDQLPRDRPEDLKKKGICGRQIENSRKAKKIVKLLAVDQSLKVDRDLRGKPKTLPKHIVCGSLRTIVRNLYAPGLSPVQELSVKTISKTDSQPCEFCLLRYEGKLADFKRQRLSSQYVDQQHLQLFGEAFSRNVPAGWNKRKQPYIPNGHATKDSSRRDGGNWNKESFSEDCGLSLVWSSGKPRVVTMYSSFNVEVLTPLHNSLYSFIKGRNWLLLGPPTQERLRYLGAGTKGTRWLSFDYESATDNIKIMYVRRMIELLIDKGEGLSVDEVDCLRALAHPRFDGELAESGQAMGSPMSFPLLCLINKTIFDMALTDLLIEGEIPFKEWTGHRCLINGDDLLTRSTSSGDLSAAIALHGGKAGLRVNLEKTMDSEVWAEINSTAFYGDAESVEIRKKTNVSSLWMGSDVSDVVGFACESTRTCIGFGRVVAANASRLARQKIKNFSKLRPVLLSALLRSKKIRVAIASLPSSEVPEAPNPFRMETEPVGFHVTREESFEAVTAEVTRVRGLNLWKELPGAVRRLGKLRKRVRASEVATCDRKTARRLLEPKPPSTEKRVMRCLVVRWENKLREGLLAASEFLYEPADRCFFDGESCSPFVQIKNFLSGFKNRAVPKSDLAFELDYLEFE